MSTLPGRKMFAIWTDESGGLLGPIYKSISEAQEDMRIMEDVIPVQICTADELQEFAREAAHSMLCHVIAEHCACECIPEKIMESWQAQQKESTYTFCAERIKQRCKELKPALDYLKKQGD